MVEDWNEEQLAALDAAEAAVSSSSSSRNDNDIASPQDIRDALQRAQTALATMRARNHAGASGRWCRCDTARLHFFHKKALTLIQRGQLDEMSEHWPMLEGPKDVTGEAKVGFYAWAAKHYTRPRDGAAAVTDTLGPRGGKFSMPIYKNIQEREDACSARARAREKEI